MKKGRRLISLLLLVWQVGWRETWGEGVLTVDDYSGRLGVVGRE